MKRRQAEYIIKDLNEKMVFLTGPRQVGKTTLARSLRENWKDVFYLNFDNLEDKSIFIRREWNRKSPLVIFDEIHKWKKWKNLIKGVYDTEGIPPRILVTGSSRLDLYRKGGDSLAGRYFSHRLYPLTVSELKSSEKPEDSLEKLILLGGFPEPYLGESPAKAKRWRKLYFDRIIKEDFRDLTSIKDIHAIAILIEMLRERIGSNISYVSLARDLQAAPQTVKNWINALESLYIIFKVVPYSRNIARAILKEPKIYFYDTGMVKDNPGVVFENIVALSLQKHLHFREDIYGEQTRLCYLKDKEKREIDFIVEIDGQVRLALEAKLSETAVHKPLLYYKDKLGKCEFIQLLRTANRPATVQGIQIEPAAAWLASLDI